MIGSTVLWLNCFNLGSKQLSRVPRARALTGHTPHFPVILGAGNVDTVSHTVLMESAKRYLMDRNFGL